MDARAIDALYRTHGHSAMRRARRILGNDDDARDVVHEVFASLVGRPEQFEGASSIVTWLYGATTHGCLNRLRNARSRRRILDAQGPRLEADGSGAPRAESLAIARELLARVPEPLASAAVYHYVDEMTHDEIATVLGCSRRHVGDLLTRVRATLQEQAP